jgi:hypothetical protein
MKFTSDDGIVVGTYAGGAIAVGHVLAKRIGAEELEMLYHGATTDGAHNAGRARARFISGSDGRIHMHIDWEWLTGDMTKGRSEWVLIDSDPRQDV